MKYVLLATLMAIAIFFAIPVSQERLYPVCFGSVQICDRNGQLLREVLSFDHKTSVWVPLEAVSPSMIMATIIQEDKRFLFHTGVDFFALTRAMFNNMKHGKILSGGSTITMQVAKMALNLRSRSVISKILQMLYALKIELHLTKKQILEIYMNRAPYGNQTYGIEAATRFYFRKSADQLSLGESCMLAVIPRAPTLLNPYASGQTLPEVKSRLLDKLSRHYYVDATSYEMASMEPLQLVNKDLNFEAPHFVDHILALLGREDILGIARVKTTIDRLLQDELEKLLFTTLESLKDYNVNQGAILVMSVETGEVLAMVGSKDYFDAKEGQVNGCLSLRQPGSSIKPFLYALALTSGMSLSEVLPDTVVEFPLRDGTHFVPHNYGRQYHGPTRLREALASSFNVPAVFLIERLGVQRFHDLLRNLGFRSLNRSAHHYGLSLSLGAGEVSLMELVNAYRVFARKGVIEDACTITSIYDHRGEKMQWLREYSEQVIPVEVAYLITDILSDNASRIKAFGVDNPLHMPFACAVKTGTSKDFRDNWCVGYTTKYMVGTWVGNFSGASMQGVSGISGAAPLFRDVMLELHNQDPPEGFEQPTTLVSRRICAGSGQIASRGCAKTIEELFISGTEPRDTCWVHNNVTKADRTDSDRHHILKGPTAQLQILNPTNGDVFKIDPHASPHSQGIRFVIQVCEGVEEVTLRLDGKVIGSEKYPFERFWHPTRGEHDLAVYASGTGKEYVDRVSFTVY